MKIVMKLLKWYWLPSMIIQMELCILRVVQKKKIGTVRILSFCIRVKI